MDFRTCDAKLCRRISEIVGQTAEIIAQETPEFTPTLEQVADTTAFYIAQYHGLTSEEFESKKFAAQVKNDLTAAAEDWRNQIFDCDPWAEGDLIDPEEDEL